MRDEGFRSPYGVLNVARTANLEEVEAAFARSYKAARRMTGGDRRRQELNAALEVLRDEDRRAQVEVDWFAVPLQATAHVPEASDLAAELLPLALQAPDDPAGQVAGPSPAEVAADYLAQRPAVPWPEPRGLLRSLAARAALLSIDPWSDPDGERQ